MKFGKMAAVLVAACALLSVAAASTAQMTEYNLSGQVVNSDNDNPIYDAKLTFHNQMTSETTYEYTDSGGNYNVQLEAGSYDVTVEAEDFDFSDQYISIYSDQTREFRLDPVSLNGDGSGDGSTPGIDDGSGTDNPFGDFDTSALESLIFIVLALVIIFFVCLVTITIALVAMFVRLGKVRKELGEINKNLDVLKKPAQQPYPPQYQQPIAQPPVFQQPQQGYQQPPAQQ